MRDGRSTSSPISRRHALRLAGGFAALAAARPAAATSDMVQSATVTIEQVQIAFIGSGNLGGGTLFYGGQKYSFTIGGLGIGGFGVSRMTATGIVYNMRDLNDFPGAYLAGRY